jgi:sugar lactone lactonase YvrE
MRFVFSILALVALLAACAREPEPAVDAASPAPEAAEAPVPEPIAEGLQTPESVLYDPDRDVYYVSNINGSPLEADGNGFISRVNAASGEIEIKWIDGSADGVRLDAPKGMGIVGDELWVTDITTVRRFERVSGAPRGEIQIAGTSFLNDIAVSGETAWVSDTGFRAGEGGFEPSGTDAIYRIERSGAVERIAFGEMLGKPNGLAADGGSLWVVTFGADELYQLSEGEKTIAAKLPQGSLDGLVQLPDGDFLVSSWEGSAVYRGRPGGAFTPLVENIDAPADIGFDTKRNLVLVPHFNENRVSFHRLD